MLRKKIAIAATALCLLTLTACASRTVYQAPADDVYCPPAALYRVPERVIHNRLLQQDARTWGDYKLDAAECNAVLRKVEKQLNELKGQTDECRN